MTFSYVASLISAAAAAFCGETTSSYMRCDTSLMFLKITSRILATVKAAREPAAAGAADPGAPVLATLADSPLLSISSRASFASLLAFNR